MSGDPFDFDSLRKRAEDFTESIPAALRAHILTADLSVGMEELTDRLESPFTVAVVGQMRVGKSSLLNALIGQDLAITGVNETTATINWLKHGGPELQGQFRVVWKDAPEELLPRSRLGEWVGNSDAAERTKFLEFFSDSSVLKKANFVDTPGLRSVIGSHEETIKEFLVQKWSRDSLRQGGKADAIIYVFPSTARETDDARLSEFEDSRIPGSSPANAIGVLHKWDALDDEDPVAIASKKAEILGKALSDKVCEIIPVSAPLYHAGSHWDDDLWSRVRILSLQTEQVAFEDLLLSECDFRENANPSVKISSIERAEMLVKKGIPWPSFRLLLRMVRRLGVGEIEDLRLKVRHASGIPKLHAALEARFFSRGRVLKMLSLISRLREPCEAAVLRLEGEISHCERQSRKLLGFADAIENAEAHSVDHEKELKDVRQYILSLDSGLGKSRGLAAEALDILDEHHSMAMQLYRSFDLDFQCIDLLDDTVKENLVSPTDRLSLLHLFGFFGAELSARAAPWQKQVDSSDVDLSLRGFIESLGHLRSHPRLHRVVAHANRRRSDVVSALS